MKKIISTVISLSLALTAFSAFAQHPSPSPNAESVLRAQIKAATKACTDALKAAQTSFQNDTKTARQNYLDATKKARDAHTAALKAAQVLSKINYSLQLLLIWSDP